MESFLCGALLVPFDTLVTVFAIVTHDGMRSIPNSRSLPQTSISFRSKFGLVL